MREAGRGRGLWLGLGAFLLGVRAADCSWLDPAALIWLIPALALPLIAYTVRTRGVALAPALVAGALLLGLARGGQERQRRAEGERLLPYAGKEPVRILFRVEEEPELGAENTVLWGVVEAVEAGEGWRALRAPVRLMVGGMLTGLYRGDLAAARARLKPPRAFRNPGAFDYEGFLGRRGAAVSGWTGSADELVLVTEPGWPSVLGLIDRVRERYLAWLMLTPGRGGGLMRAVLAGDRKALPPEVEEAFQDTGLAHLVVVSGLHLGLVAFVFFWLFDRAVRLFPWLVLRVPAVKAAAALTIVPVVSYAVISGLRLPTQRALVMALTYLLATALDRRRDAWNTLALAALAVSWIWPGAVGDMSFRLSFVCVGGILYVFPRFDALWKGRKGQAAMELDRYERRLGHGGRGRLVRVGAHLLGLLAISTATNWAIFPFQANYFHLTNPLGPLYNLAAIPVVGYFLIPLGMIDSVLALVWPGGAQVVMGALAMLADGMLALIVGASRAAPSAVLLPPMSGPGTLAWYIGGAALLEAAVAWRCRTWSWRFFSPRFFRVFFLESIAESVPDASRRVTLALAAIGLAALIAVGIDLGRSRDPFPPGWAGLAAIDVGQGQALLYRSAEGKFLLIDGGGLGTSPFDVGRGVVTPCLLTLGVRRLAVVALTHPHPDHARGLGYILRHFPVGEFWCTDEQDELTRELRDTARERGIPVRLLDDRAGAFTYHGIAVRVLGPPPDAGKIFDDANDRSLVLRLTSAGAAMLLPGDAGKKAEPPMIAKYGPAGTAAADALRALVLVAPHHGSKYSSSPAFLDAVRPRFVLVSAGGPEVSRLPSADALARFAERGITVLRTDQDGWVAVAVKDGQVIRIISP
jgi:competence protein ComEC